MPVIIGLLMPRSHWENTSVMVKYTNFLPMLPVASRYFGKKHKWSHYKLDFLGFGEGPANHGHDCSAMAPDARRRFSETSATITVRRKSGEASGIIRRGSANLLGWFPDYFSRQNFGNASGKISMQALTFFGLLPMPHDASRWPSTSPKVPRTLGEPLTDASRCSSISIRNTSPRQKMLSGT